MVMTKLIRAGEHSETTFSLEDEHIHVSSDVMDVSISLGFLLDDEQRFNIFNSLAHSHFATQEWFSSTLSLGNSDEVSPHFTSEDYEFAEYVKTMGLPLDYAIRIAFNTSFATESGFAEKRIAALEHFRERNFDVKVENSGTFQGFTTLDAYIPVAVKTNCRVADELAETALFEPAVLIQGIRDLWGLIKIGTFDESVEKLGLAALSSVVSESFPDDPQKLKGIIEVLSLNPDWGAAGRLLPGLERNGLVRFFSEKLGGRYVNDNSNDLRKCRNLVALMISIFGESLMKEVAEFIENARYLRVNAHWLLVYVTVLDHVHQGGSLTDPIDWILATNPDIDQDDVIIR